QYWGKRDIAGVRRSFGASLAASLSASLLFTAAALAAPGFLIGLYSPDAEVVALGARYLRIVALSYIPTAATFSLSLSLRSVERVKLPLAATVVSLLANAFLNWVLIFGKLGLPAMGVEGAAWATVDSRAIEFAVVYGVAYSRRYAPAGGLRELADWGGGWGFRFAAVVLPVVVNEVAWSLGITTYNAVFARLGTGPIASYNVINTVNQLAMVLFFGTANAAAVMIGNKIGEGDRRAALVYSRRFALMAPVLGVAVGLLLFPVRALLPLLFRLDAAVLAEAASMLVVLGACFPFRVFNLHVVVGICRAGGDTRFGMLLDMVGVWAVGVPLAALGAFVWGFPAWAVFLLTQVEEIAKSFVGLWRILSGSWVRDVTAEESK
ncbi:MAG: MATE family efflux transporter, partial [Spirochaetaceae bacterium]|nr:MATE family efflux transporter [Spirochaetaceae bacterium]